MSRRFDSLDLHGKRARLLGYYADFCELDKLLPIDPQGVIQNLCREMRIALKHLDDKIAKLAVVALVALSLSACSGGGASGVPAPQVAVPTPRATSTPFVCQPPWTPIPGGCAGTIIVHPNATSTPGGLPA